MFVDYQPEGKSKQRFEWNAGRVRLSEAASIEAAYSKLAGDGKTFQEFVNDIRQGAAVARRLLLHRLLRRQHPTIRFEDVDPYDDEVKILFSKAELEELRAGVEKTSSIPEADKQRMLAKLDEEIADAPETDDPGKSSGTSGPESGPSETSGGSTE